MKIRLLRLLFFSFGLTVFLPVSVFPSLQGSSLSTDTDVLKDGSRFQKLIVRLGMLDEPVSREGAGKLIIQSPGERYSLHFRLLARGPEALRLEIFDPFGRPLLYFISYEGETHLFSIPQKKEIPFNLPSSGPWSDFPEITIVELLKIFWGRVPVLPYETYRSSVGSDQGKESVKLEFKGSVDQEIWITPSPFTLTKSRITRPSREGEIEISFSDFSESAGNRTPMRCEITNETENYMLSIRYETLVPRPDISDEIFKLPRLSDLPSTEKGINP